VFETIASILEDLVRQDRSTLMWLIDGLKLPDSSLSHPFGRSLVNLGLNRNEKAEMVEEVMHFHRLGWVTSISTPMEVCDIFSQDGEVLDLFEKQGLEVRRTLAWMQSNEDHHIKAIKETQDEVARIEKTFLHLSLDDKIRYLLALDLNAGKCVLEKHWDEIIGHPGFEAVISKILNVLPPRLDL
jgi:hypothetical protein